MIEKAAATTEEEPVDTGIEDEAPAAMTDDLTIEMAEADDGEADDDPDPLSTEAQVLTILVRALPKALEPHLARLDQRSRDRMHSTLAEATARATSIEDAIEEIQQFCDDLRERFEDLAARVERVEEACGLRPSLLTTAESAVARLDEMAQGGKLRANDIRAIHRQLRAAVQEERARRQG